MPLIFIGICRGIKIYKNTSLKKDEYYLACSTEIITGILNYSNNHVILHNSEKIIDLAKDNKKKAKGGSNEKG